MTPTSNQDTYIEANNPQYVQAPSPIDSLADLDEDVILGDITEEDRRAILEEKIELDMDWLTLLCKSNVISNLPALAKIETIIKRMKACKRRL